MRSFHRLRAALFPLSVLWVGRACQRGYAGCIQAKRLFQEPCAECREHSPLILRTAACWCAYWSGCYRAPLHVNGGQLRELQSADSGLDMLLDIRFVAFDRARLYTVQIFRRPCPRPRGGREGTGRSGFVRRNGRSNTEDWRQTRGGNVGPYCNADTSTVKGGRV